MHPHDQGTDFGLEAELERKRNLSLAETARNTPAAYAQRATTTQTSAAGFARAEADISGAAEMLVGRSEKMNPAFFDAGGRAYDRRVRGAATIASVATLVYFVLVADYGEKEHAFSPARRYIKAKITDMFEQNAGKQARRREV